jgi:hypothetical protein
MVLTFCLGIGVTFYINGKLPKPQPLVITRTESMTKEVIKVQTKYVIKKIYVNRPNKPAEVLVTEIETSTPSITINPIVVTINSNSVEFPKSVTGSIQVSYLTYDFSSEFIVKTMIQYNKVPISLFASGYLDDFSIGYNAGIAYSFLTPYNTTSSLGVGISGMQLGIGGYITQNGFYQAGLVYAWGTKEVSPFLGFYINL